MKSHFTLKELKSWCITAGGDLITEFILALLTGLQTLIAGGGLTKAALIAVLTAAATATIRSGLKLVVKKLKPDGQ